MRNEELYDWLCNKGGSDGLGMWHVWGRTEIGGRFWWGHLPRRHHLEGLSADGGTILKWKLEERRGMWTGLIWLRTGASGGIL